MKKILIQTSTPMLDNDNLFKEYGGNNVNLRWRVLRDRFANLGYTLTTADNKSLEDCEGIIFQDATSLYGITDQKTKIKNSIKKLLGRPLPAIYPTRNLYKEAIDAGLKDKMIFIICEGKSVIPLNFSATVWNMFNKILTWDDSLLKNPKFVQYLLPIEDRRNPKNFTPFKERKLLANMSINKYSPYKHELYTARRNSITYFDKYYPNDFDLFGYRWNMPANRMQQIFPSLVKKYQTFRGEALDKIETLSRYKFNICYENNSDANGYITEKIFNSFDAGMVPIYWGATNIEKYVDPDAFIDRRKFKDDTELAEFITKISEEDYNKYIEAGKRYMQSTKYARFSLENFCDTIISALGIHNEKN